MFERLEARGWGKHESKHTKVHTAGAKHLRLGFLSKQAHFPKAAAYVK